MGIIGRCMFVLGICSCRHFEVDRIMGWLSVCERRVNSEFDVTRRERVLFCYSKYRWERMSLNVAYAFLNVDM